MTCSSIASLLRSCGEGVVAGLEKLYMIAYKDLTSASGGTETYTLSSSGIINHIGLATGKTFVEVELLKSTAGMKEDAVIEPSKGVAYFKQELSIVLGNLTTDNRTFIETVLTQPVAILMKTRTGKYFAAGLNKQLFLSKAEGGTGVQENDLIGYSLTFEGVDTALIRMVDDTIITSLVA